MRGVHELCYMSFKFSEVFFFGGISQFFQTFLPGVLPYIFVPFWPRLPHFYISNSFTFNFVWHQVLPRKRLGCIGDACGDDNSSFHEQVYSSWRALLSWGVLLYWFSVLFLVYIACLLLLPNINYVLAVYLVFPAAELKLVVKNALAKNQSLGEVTLNLPEYIHEVLAGSGKVLRKALQS